MSFPLHDALATRILIVRARVNQTEKRMIEEAVRRKFGENFSLSNALRTALNLLLDIDLPMLERGEWMKGNRHHTGKRGGNRYTVEKSVNPTRSRYCVWCGRGRARI